MAARKVMVVADSSRESSGALQYTLTNVLGDQDELILVYVENPSSWKNPIVPIATFLRNPSISSSSMTPIPFTASSEEEVNFLKEMKNACEVAQPKVRVHLAKVQTEGNNKGDAILSQAEVFGVDLLVIGQRRSLSDTILRQKLPGGSLKGTKGGSLKGMDTAEYLIENSKCNCVGVHKKGQNEGYLINSKTHKNFWLLA